jgi:Tol biopolymer transport system component
VAGTVWGATDAVYIYDFAGRGLRRVTSQGNCAFQSWTHDGRRIMFTSDRGGQEESFLADADGSGKAERIDVDFQADAFRLALPNQEGNALVYYHQRGWWLVDVEGKSKPQLVTGMPTGFHSESVNPTLAPGGRWLAYDQPGSSGQREVYVASFPSGDDRWQISRNGGTAPRWSPRGDELFYEEPTQKGRRMKAVRVSAELSPGPPVDLFAIPPELTFWGLHPDGARFLATKVLEPEFAGDRVEAILNWFDEVAARAPRAR